MLNLHLFPYFTCKELLCVSFLNFKLRDGTPAYVLADLFVDNNDRSYQGLSTLKPKVRRYGLQKLLINTCTGDPLGVEVENPLLDKPKEAEKRITIHLWSMVKETKVTPLRSH